MALFNLEHGKLAYRVDAGFYVVAVASVGIWLAATLPSELWPATSIWVVSGIAGWSLIEYGIHRFVLHGLQPFQRWHEARIIGALPRSSARRRS